MNRMHIGTWYQIATYTFVHYTKLQKERNVTSSINPCEWLQQQINKYNIDIETNPFIPK